MSQRRRKTKVRDVMDPLPASIRIDDTLAEAAGRMQEHNIDLLAVVEDDKLVGVLTVSDLRRRGIDEEALGCLVRDVARQAVNFCLENHSVEAAAAIMAGGRVRRLPVVANDHTVVGIVSLSRLAATASPTNRTP